MDVTPWFTPLQQLSVVNDPVPLAYFFPLVAWLEVSSDPTQCACAPGMLKRLNKQVDILVSQEWLLSGKCKLEFTTRTRALTKSLASNNCPEWSMNYGANWLKKYNVACRVPRIASVAKPKLNTAVADFFVVHVDDKQQQRHLSSVVVWTTLYK